MPSPSRFTTARARVAALQRACALGGVALSLLTPGAHAQSAPRPIGTRPDSGADRAGTRLTTRLSAPVRRIDASTPGAGGTGEPVFVGRGRGYAGLAVPDLPNGPNDFNATPVVADIDRDGDRDVLFGRRTGGFRLFRNTAAPGAAPAFSAPETLPGLTNFFDGSAPSTGDFDGDGDLDILSGERDGAFYYYRNTSEPGGTSVTFLSANTPAGLTDVGDASRPSVGDLDGDGDLDVLAGNDAGTLSYFVNTAGPGATPVFALAATPAGLGGVEARSAPAVADVDGDGDVDVLIGNGAGTLAYFENMAGPGATPVFRRTETPEGLGGAGYNATPAFGDLDGDGDLDVLAGDRDGQLTYFERLPGPPLSGLPLLAADTPPGLAAISDLSTPALADLDGDGDMDLLTGLADGTFAYFRNAAGRGNTPAFVEPTTPTGLTGVPEGRSAPAVADLDGDGDADVLAGNRDGDFFYFVNTAGPGNAPAFALASTPAGLTSAFGLAAPTVADFDGDGDLDVLSGSFTGFFLYFRNTAGPGNAPVFADRVQDPFGLSDVGDNSRPSAGDLDGDGDLDLLVGNEAGRFVYFENLAGPGSAPAFGAPAAVPGLRDVGADSAPTVADLDGDGDLDMIAGELNRNFNYFRNPQTAGTAAGTTLTARVTGADGYRMLAAPSRTTSIGSLLGPAVYTQGFPGATAPGGGSTVYLYDETVPGSQSAGYVLPGSTASAVGIGRGLLVYVFADEDPRPSAPGQQGGFPKVLTATGRPELTGFVWGAAGDAPLTFTDSPAPNTDDGWNLLGNPFASWFDWDAVDLLRVNAPVYVYDNAIASYRSHVRGVPAGNLNGGIIGPFQGFWVQANAASPALTALPGVSSGGPLLRGAAGGAAASVPTVVGLRLRPGAESALPVGIRSEAFLALGVDGAQPGVSLMDARALLPPSASYVMLATEAATEDGSSALLAIDARPAPAGVVTVALDVTAVVNGAAAGTDLVLDWPALALPAGWTARLLDSATGEVVDMAQAAEYAFTLEGPAAQAAPSDALALPNAAPEVAEALAPGRFTLVVTPNGATAAGESPGSLALSAARPNPTTGATSLVLSLPGAAHVRAAVVDALGREVLVLHDGDAAGTLALSVDGARLAPGVYTVRVVGASSTLTQRLTVVR